jgi:hypothetical protein
MTDFAEVKKDGRAEMTLMEPPYEGKLLSLPSYVIGSYRWMRQTFPLSQSNFGLSLAS